MMATIWSRMQAFTKVYSTVLIVAALTATGISAQGVEGTNGGPGQAGGQSSGQGSNQESTIAQYQYFINGDALPQRQTLLIAHAVMACLVWAFLIPLGGILLRLNIKSPWALRMHAILQITSFLLYISAVGLGIFLINTLGSFSSMAWQTAHPRLGIAILAMATIQPFLGYLHHRIFKRNMMQMRPGEVPLKQRRTIWGQAHLWLGRILIALGCINGGLGMKLVEKQPAWLMPAPKAARIGYAAGVTVSTGIYMVIVMMYERKRRQSRLSPPVTENGGDSPRAEEQKILTGPGHPK